MGTWIKGIPPKMIQDTFEVLHGKWYPEMDRCWIRKEDGCCVCSRLIRTKFGNVEHVTITRRMPGAPIFTNNGSGELMWAEKQQIKNELFGENRQAIEVYPAEDRLVNSADVYHLWVFDKKFRLPFGIHPKEYQKAVNRGYSMTLDEIKTVQQYYKERHDGES